MKVAFALLVALFSTVAISIYGKETAPSAQPYIGEWSNGRGETLVITAAALQFASDAPLPYRDITKTMDGGVFHLMIIAKGKKNYFFKYLWITMHGTDEMKIESADSIEELSRGEASWQTWYR